MKEYKISDCIFRVNDRGSVFIDEYNGGCVRISIDTLREFLKLFDKDSYESLITSEEYYQSLADRDFIMPFFEFYDNVKSDFFMDSDGEGYFMNDKGTLIERARCNCYYLDSYRNKYDSPNYFVRWFPN